MPGGPKIARGRWSPAVGRYFQTVIDDRSITQTSLAHDVGISPSQMSKYLRGDRTLNLDELEAICRVLALDLVDVLIEADEATSE